MVVGVNAGWRERKLVEITSTRVGNIKPPVSMSHQNRRQMAILICLCTGHFPVETVSPSTQVRTVGDRNEFGAS